MLTGPPVRQPFPTPVIRMARLIGPFDGLFGSAGSTGWVADRRVRGFVMSGRARVCDERRHRIYPRLSVKHVAGALVQGSARLGQGLVGERGSGRAAVAVHAAARAQPGDCLLSVPAGASSATGAAVGAGGRCSHVAGGGSARLRRLVMWLVALQLVCGVLVAPSAARGVLRVPVLRWVPCDRGFECASARVPLDYRDPGGSMIRLAVIRHRVSDPAHRLGSLFFNPGGPGGRGTALLPVVFRFFPAALRARFDIVSWDPRGVGESTAVQCFASQRAEQRFFGALLAPDSSFPVGKAQISRWIGRSREFGRRCAQRNGRLLEHVSTLDTARDLDLLRRALGDRWMNYLGVSYGTFLGATYANLFPDRVRAMVLDGNVNPAAWVGRQLKANGGRFLPTHLRLRSDQGAAKTLRAFLDLCGRAGVAHCAFSAGSAAATRSKFAALLARLPRQPVKGKMSYAELVSKTIAALYSEPGWSGWAQKLQNLWTKGAASQATAGRSLLRSNDSARSAPRAARASDRYAGFEQQAAILCSESPNPRPPAYGALDAFASRRSGVAGPAWAWLDETCASWPAHAAELYAGPWNRRTAHPVLVIGTTYDPATPYQSAVAMSHQLARARLLTVDGYGHTSGASACADRYKTRYLISGTLPPRAAKCAQNKPPFTG